MGIWWRCSKPQPFQKDGRFYYTINQIPTVATGLSPPSRRGARSCHSDDIEFLKGKSVTFLRTEGGKNGVVT